MGVTPFASVDRLLELAGACSAPNRVDWLLAQRTVGSVLPGDYKQLVELTGPVYVGQFLTVFVPGVANPNVDLIVQVGQHLGALQVIKANWGSRECPYPLWFEPGGLFPWGCSDNGDSLFWLTHGHPDQWTVVIGQGRGPKYEEYPLSTCEFLVEFVSGRLKSRIFPDGAPLKATVDLIDPAVPLE